MSKELRDEVFLFEIIGLKMPQKFLIAPRTNFLLIFLLGLLLYLPFNWQMELVHEEPRRVVITQNMLSSGDFLTPKLNDATYMAKPPLFNWWIAIVTLPFAEISEFAARLSSLLALFILIGFFFYRFYHHLGLVGINFLSLSLLTTPHLAAKIGLAEIEITFMALVTLSIWEWFYRLEKGLVSTRLWTIPCLFVTMAFLCKREPAILFFYLPVFFTLVFSRRFKEFFSLGHFLGLGILFLGLLIWPGTLLIQSGVESFIDDMKREVLQRGHERDFLISHWLKHVILYPIKVWAAQLPNSLLLLFLFFPMVRVDLWQRNSKLLTFGCLIISTNLLPYLIRTDIAVRYLMPIYPSFLLLSSLVAQHLWNKNIKEKYFILFSKAISFIFITIATLLFFSPIVRHFDDQFFHAFRFTEKMGPPWVNPLISIFLSLVFLTLLYTLIKKHKSSSLKVLVFSLIISSFAWRWFEVHFTLPQKSFKLNQREHFTSHFEEIYKLIDSPHSPLYAPVGLEAKIWYYDPEKRLVQMKFDEILERTKATPSWLLYSSHDQRFTRTLQGLSLSEEFKVESLYRGNHRAGEYILVRLKRVY